MRSAYITHIPCPSKTDFVYCRLLTEHSDADPAAEIELEGDSSCSTSPTSSVTTPSVPMKIVDLVLVLGGMDTQGEIFDDCLVLWLEEQALAPSDTGLENPLQGTHLS